jgi:hypothetical protein
MVTLDGLDRVTLDDCMELLEYLEASKERQERVDARRRAEAEARKP